MGAHSRPFSTQCSASYCTKRATEEVFNTYNSPQGVFCKKHATERVKDLLEGERQMHRAQMAAAAPDPLTEPRERR